MSGKIYLVRDDGTLRAMREQPYASEELLQRLLEEHPDFLAVDQIDEDLPCRWLLVSREVAVPGEAEGTGRWSLDHLFLDQDAVPTLVEVKRSSDTRIRREVVGQMLDYAANAVMYWPIETIRSKFEAACEKRGEDPAQLITDLVGAESVDGVAVETFWAQVKTNLQAGRVRLVFVADKIPAELQRIVEFLNGQMDPAEVLAIELRQFVGEGIQTLVPRVLGLTAVARQKKSTGAGEERQWDETSFFGELESQHGSEAVQTARSILNWIRPLVSRVWWGQGQQMGSFVPILQQGRQKVHFFATWTTASIEIYFQYLQAKPPFNVEDKRRELLDRLNKIPGFNLPSGSIARRPVRPISLLCNAEALKQFQETIEWGLDEVKNLGADS